MDTIPSSVKRPISLISGITALAGVYLAVSPVISGHVSSSGLSAFMPSSGLTTLNVTLGVGIAVLGVFKAALGWGVPWLSWCTVALGVLTILTPWGTGYQGLEFFARQHLIVGGLVIVLEVISAVLTHRYNASREASRDVSRDAGRPSPAV